MSSFKKFLVYQVPEHLGLMMRIYNLSSLLINITKLNRSNQSCFYNHYLLLKGWSSLILFVSLNFLSLCALASNAKFENLFDDMKIIKTDWRNPLNKENLEALLRVKVDGPDLWEFAKHFCGKNQKETCRSTRKKFI